MHFVVCSISPVTASWRALYIFLSLGQICMTDFPSPLLSRSPPRVSIVVGFFAVAPTNQLCAAPHIMLDILARGASLRFGYVTYSMLGFHGSTGDVLLLCATDCDTPLILRRGSRGIVVGVQYHMHPTPQTQECLASILLPT
jgi:hypothetical protein